MDLLIGTGDWYSTRSRLTWKLKGTKSNRLYFQLFPSTLHTDGIEFGLLPTIQTQGLKECENGKTVFTNLDMLPTPDCSDRRSDKSEQWGLSNYAKNQMLPSPVASDATTGAIIGKNDTFKETKGLPRKINQNGKDGSVGFARLVKLLPTPTADDNPAKNTGKRNQDGLQKRAYETTGKTSQLNPLFVAEMMSFHPQFTVKPFQKSIIWTEI